MEAASSDGLAIADDLDESRSSLIVVLGIGHALRVGHAHRGHDKHDATLSKASRKVGDGSRVHRVDVSRVSHLPTRDSGLRGDAPESQHRRTSRVLSAKGEISRARRVLRYVVGLAFAARREFVD